jgi:hypothetical protein
MSDAVRYALTALILAGAASLLYVDLNYTVLVERFGHIAVDSYCISVGLIGVWAGTYALRHMKRKPPE